MKRLRALVSAAFPGVVPELDLHGLRVPEALEAVRRALEKAEARGDRELRIVCGKGRGSPGGVGVLREAVPGWLEANGYAGRYRRLLDADGRDGAVLVRLRGYCPA
ncbi:MAG: Smr/MutS family protein [Deltaproteobacteria bacterium]|nr:Smr/MutS family protein [Deltaproteobacteria bacterium]